MAARIRLTGKQSDFSAIVLTAAARGDLGAVQSLVRVNPAWVRQVGSHGRTVLWEAAYKGHLVVVEYLIGRGADLNQPGCYYTPMLAELNPCSAAVLMKHMSVANALEKSGGMVDFHDACYLGDESRVRETLKRDRSAVIGRKAQTSDPQAAKPIFYAVAGARPVIVKELLRHIPVGHARDGLLLRWAGWTKNIDIIDQLLSHGANPADSHINDWALDADLKELATRHGHEVDINAPDWLGFPALVGACRGNHNQSDNPERVRGLLAAGADVGVKDRKGKTALHRAAQAGFTQIPALLLGAGARVDEQDCNGETAIFDAIRGRHIATVALLLQAEANVHTRNHRGKSALDIAARLLSPARESILELVGRPQ